MTLEPKPEAVEIILINIRESVLWRWKCWTWKLRVGTDRILASEHFISCICNIIRGIIVIIVIKLFIIIFLTASISYPVTFKYLAAGTNAFFWSWSDNYGWETVFSWNSWAGDKVDGWRSGCSQSLVLVFVSRVPQCKDTDLIIWEPL